MISLRNAVVAGMVVGIGLLGNAFGQEKWTVKSPIPNLNNVIWAGTQFVAVGDSGAIFTSADGTGWVRRSSGTTRRLTAAAWTGGKIVVVGDSVVTTSGDGNTWMVTGVAGVANFSAVIWAGTQFIALGYYGIYSSPDGFSWTRRDSTTTYAVAFGNNLLVAICGNSGKILTSSDGINWTKKDSLGTGYNNEMVIWNGTQFIAYSNGKALTSTNGITWTTDSKISTPGGSTIWTGIQFVSVSLRGSSIYTSPDAIKWTMRDAPVSYDASNANAPLIAIAFSPSGQIVAVGINTILSSSDGITWVSRTSGISQDLYSIVRTTNKWITASASIIYSSSDASNWSLTQTPVFLNRSYYSTIPMIWTGTQLVLACNPATSTSTTTLFTSPDGTNWKQCITNTPTLYGVASSGNQIVGVGYQGKVLTSTDGNTWIYRNSGTYNNLYAITWTGTQFVSVGGEGEIITSPDGISWTRRYVDQINYLTSILWTGSQLVAVGYRSTIITSPDAITWTIQNSGVSADLFGIAGTANRMAAVGTNLSSSGAESGSLILSSRDGITWTKRSTGTSAVLHSIAYADSQFVAVGDNGTVLISPLSTSVTSPLAKSAAPVFSPQLNRRGITVELSAGRYALSIIDMAGRVLYSSSGTAGTAVRRTFNPAISTNCCIVKLDQGGLVRAKKLMMVD